MIKPASNGDAKSWSHWCSRRSRPARGLRKRLDGDANGIRRLYPKPANVLKIAAAFERWVLAATSEDRA